MAFFNYTKEGKGISKDEEKAPAIALFFTRLGRRFWQLVVLNILYIFACLPIVTIGPATAGMTYVVRNFTQGKPVEMLADFFGKAKENFGKSVAIFFINIVVLAIGGASVYLWSDRLLDELPAWMRTIGLVVVFFVLYVFICANFYIYPMLVSFDLTLKQLLRNSLILGAYTLGWNLAMIVFDGVIIFACWILWPMSLPVIFFLAISLCFYFNNFIVFPVLKKRVALKEEPEQEQRPDDEEQIFTDTVKK